MSTEPEYTKPVWAPECPWGLTDEYAEKRREGWMAAEAAIYAALEGTAKEDETRALVRAFVQGVKWWEVHNTGATLWPSDRDHAENEALSKLTLGTLGKSTLDMVESGSAGRENPRPRRARKQPRKRIKVTKYWKEDGPCLILAGSYDSNVEIAAQYFRDGPPAYWKEYSMSEEDFTNLPEFES